MTPLQSSIVSAIKRDHSLVLKDHHARSNGLINPMFKKTFVDLMTNARPIIIEPETDRAMKALANGFTDAEWSQHISTCWPPYPIIWLEPVVQLENVKAGMLIGRMAQDVSNRPGPSRVQWMVAGIASKIGAWVNTNSINIYPNGDAPISNVETICGLQSHFSDCLSLICNPKITNMINFDQLLKNRSMTTLLLPTEKLADSVKTILAFCILWHARSKYDPTHRAPPVASDGATTFPTESFSIDLPRLVALRQAWRGGHHASPRLHDVAGHWRRRRDTGQRHWVREHKRGSGEDISRDIIHATAGRLTSKIGEKENEH